MNMISIISKIAPLFSLLAGCLVGFAIPMPRDRPSPPTGGGSSDYWIVGTWDIQWGTGRQVTKFRDDGTSRSTCGNGIWWIEDGDLHFTEGHERRHYFMRQDCELGLIGFQQFDRDDDLPPWFNGPVDVKIKRRETGGK